MDEKDFLKGHVQRRSQIHEESLAKEFKGQRQPGSGNKDFNKGDVKGESLDSFLIEAKSCGKGFRMTVKLWNKIKLEARREERIPLMEVKFDNGLRLRILSDEDFRALILGE